MLLLVTLGYLLILEIHLQWLKSIIVSLKKFFLIHKNDKALKSGGGGGGEGGGGGGGEKKPEWSSEANNSPRKPYGHATCIIITQFFNIL